jgi:hypothetical protein
MNPSKWKTLEKKFIFIYMCVCVCMYVYLICRPSVNKSTWFHLLGVSSPMCFESKLLKFLKFKQFVDSLYMNINYNLLNTVEAWKVFCNHPYGHEIECHYGELYFAFQEVHCHVNKALINKTSSKTSRGVPLGCRIVSLLDIWTCWC